MHYCTFWTMCLEVETDDNILKARTILMVHYDAIRTQFFRTPENILKSRSMYGAFWRYLNQCFWSWNCCENFKSKDAKWCILPLFGTILGSWNCWENLEIKNDVRCILSLFQTIFRKFLETIDVLEVGTA